MVYDKLTLYQFRALVCYFKCSVVKTAAKSCAAKIQIWKQTLRIVMTTRRCIWLYSSKLVIISEQIQEPPQF